MKHFLTYGKRSNGRPSVADLSADDLTSIQANFLETNRTQKDGSILLAWVRFCEANPRRFGHLVADHMPATTIPAAAVEACRKARGLIGAARGGAPRQRHEGAYVPGTMRRHHAEERRLYSGERASVDDATRNVACYIPWPWGGCPCSDKFGVKLGRWQTLLVHDDASGYVPFISTVFRWQQSYRATDAASVIFRAERDVLEWDNWSIEGGVWQSKRSLAALGSRWISAKGRPNQKLVENYFGRLWTVMAGQKGDVGRHRAEIKRNSDLYLKCRAGSEDPRKHFMSLTQGQEALYTAVDYLNEKRIESRTYGKWVPQARWEADLAERPRTARNPANEFLLAPVCETRKVRSGMFKTTADGPHGVPMVWSFAADLLWQFEGREVTAYFDPMQPWPVHATVCLKGTRTPLGTVECINSYGESKDRAADLVKSIRNTMMSETRVLLTKATERVIRHNEGVIVSTSAPCPHVDTPEICMPDRQILTPAAREISLPATGLRETSAAAPRITREDLSDSLSRRAKRARESQVSY